MGQQGGSPTEYLGFRVYAPLGDNPSRVFVLDIKHEEGAILTRSEEHSVIILGFRVYTPLGDNPSRVFVLDIEHKEGAILTGSKEHSIIICQHELSNG